jgi:hypothetical protein
MRRISRCGAYAETLATILRFGPPARSRLWHLHHWAGCGSLLTLLPLCAGAQALAALFPAVEAFRLNLAALVSPQFPVSVLGSVLQQCVMAKCDGL